MDSAAKMNRVHTMYRDYEFQADFSTFNTKSSYYDDGDYFFSLSKDRKTFKPIPVSELWICDSSSLKKELYKNQIVLVFRCSWTDSLGEKSCARTSFRRDSNKAIKTQEAKKKRKEKRKQTEQRRTKKEK